MTFSRQKNLAAKEILYVDVGTSGGVWGLERGYCVMIGGEKEVVQHIDPIFSALAPGIGDIPRMRGREILTLEAALGVLEFPEPVSNTTPPLLVLKCPVYCANPHVSSRLIDPPPICFAFVLCQSV